MKIDVQFGDEYTVTPDGRMFQYRGSKFRTLGDSEWWSELQVSAERTIPYSLFRQIAEAAGHEIDERTVCYRAKGDWPSIDRYRVWPDGSWCHVSKDGSETQAETDPFILSSDLTLCDDAPLVKPTPTPKPATLTVWAATIAANGLICLYDSESKARAMSLGGYPVHRIDLPIGGVS